MEISRLDDMLLRYGEVCTQHTASRILNVNERTIARMMDDGRLRRVAHRVDVRSIVSYIENPEQANFKARATKSAPTTRLSEGEFLAAAKAGRWSSRR